MNPVSESRDPSWERRAARPLEIARIWELKRLQYDQRDNRNQEHDRQFVEQPVKHVGANVSVGLETREIAPAPKMVNDKNQDQHGLVHEPLPAEAIAQP